MNQPNIKVADLLSVLENELTPALTKTAEATPAPVVEKTAEVLETERLQKLAEEADAEGRIAARAFYDELQKIAVSPVGMTPNPASIPDNPGTQVSTGEISEQNVQAVVKAIMSLTNGERLAGPVGNIQVNNAPVAPAAPVVDEYPIAIDSIRKTASLKVYNKYFGGK